MLKFSADQIIRNIDDHWRYLLPTRALIPALKFESAESQDSFSYNSPPYYAHRGYDITVHFRKRPTDELITDISMAGHFVNQGFVVWLCAYLEYCGIYGDFGEQSNIEKLSGNFEVKLLKKSRNYFAHSSGFYNPKNSRKKKLHNQIVDHFGISGTSHPEEDKLFPIPIDTVLEPLVEACKQYVKELEKLDATKQQASRLAVLNDIATTAGWASWSEYETAVQNGEVAIERKAGVGKTTV